MIHRLAIFAATLVAAAGLAVGLVIAGLGPTTAPVAAEPVAAPVATTDVPAPAVQVDTVYLAPKATPEDVVVTKVVTASHRGEDGEDEREGSDD